MLTAVILATAVLWPLPRRSGDYDFSAGIFGVFHIALGIIATLVVWLVFFIII